MPRPQRRASAAEIRPARPEDLPALARLGARLARMHHAIDGARFFLPDEPIEAGDEWWRGKELRNRRAVVLAAERRGRIVGYGYGRLEPRDWNTLRDACGVGVDLWVEPGARGGGIGGRLVAALAAALEARGAERVVIDVAARNPAAQKLFRRIGFRPTMLEMARERGGTPPRGEASRRARARTRGATRSRRGRASRTR